MCSLLKKKKITSAMTRYLMWRSQNICPLKSIIFHFFYQYISWYETVIADNDYSPFNA